MNVEPKTFVALIIAFTLSILLISPAKASPQQNMLDCAQSVKNQNLKGPAYKSYMSECLKKAEAKAEIEDRNAEVREAKICAPLLQDAGTPKIWADQGTLLTFSTGYQEPIARLLCTWIQHGVKVAYSADTPHLTGPSLTIHKNGSGTVELSLSESHQNGVMFIVPTFYSGPEGTITVKNQQDLQQIFALLMNVSK